MKQIRLVLIVSILAIALSKGLAQTTVTGHVFAEVVESVSASSYSQSSVTIKRNQTKGIDFGQIEIKSGASASCSLILGRALLTSNNNQQIAMETSAYSNQSLESNAINGIQSINLQCLPGDSRLDLAATEYTGNINIVLAYN
jgi:hypothetical protein